MLNTSFRPELYHMDTHGCKDKKTHTNLVSQKIKILITYKSFYKYTAFFSLTAYFK